MLCGFYHNKKMWEKSQLWKSECWKKRKEVCFWLWPCLFPLKVGSTPLAPPSEFLGAVSTSSEGSNGAREKLAIWGKYMRGWSLDQPEG